MPPGVGREGQLGAAIGAEPFGGMSLAQLSAMQAGAVPFSSAVQSAMDAHAARNAAAVSAASGPGPWNQTMRAVYSNARWEDANYNQIMVKTRQMAEYENRELDTAYSKMRRNAEYENKEYDLRYAHMRRMADMENAAWNRAAGGGGAGGGGGGRGTVGGGGGGWGRPHIPFIGGLGFNAAAALAIGGFDAGLAGQLIGDVALAPQKIGNMMAAAIGSSQPAYDLLQFSTGFSRAVGLRGNPLEGQMYGPFHAPGWMQALGLGPTQAMGLAQRFGILGAGTGAEQGIMQALGGLPYMTGLSGVGPQAQALVGTAARYGAISPTAGGIQAYGMQLSQLMEEAVAKGMDRAAVMQSINAGIAFVARQGALGIDAGQVGNFMMRFANLPGGRTGEAGLAAMQGLAGAMGTIGRDPLRTMMAATAAAHVTTPDALSKLLGPVVFGRVMSHPEGRAMVQDYFQAVHRGDSLAAALYLNALTTGDPAAQTRILSQSQFYGGLPSYWIPLAGGAVTGQGPSRFIANQMGRGGSASLRALEVNANLGSTVQQEVMMTYDPSVPDATYEKELLRMGVNKTYVPSLIAAAKKNGISPLLAGAIMMQESSGGWNASAHGNVMQFANKVNGVWTVQPMTPQASMDLGVKRLAHDVMRGGTLQDVLQRYHGVLSPSQNAGYFAGVVSSMGVGGAFGNVPAGPMAAMADAQNAAMTASAASLHEMSAIVPKVNGALNSLTSAADRAAKALSKIGNNPYMVQPNGLPGAIPN